MQGPGYSRHPEHSVVVRISAGEWIAERAGIELARATAALVLEETGYAPVIYFPRAAVRHEHMVASETSTYCPFKGEASYLSFDGEDVAWMYVTPYDEVRAIERYIAFYPDRVCVREVAPDR